MNFYIALSIIIFSLFSNAQVYPIQVMEVGHYVGVDVETKTLNVDLILNADKTLIIKLNSPDFQIPDPGCLGNYDEIGYDLFSSVTCPLDFMSEAKIRMDTSKVNHDSIRSENGVEIPVYIDAVGTEPTLFLMKIIE